MFSLTGFEKHGDYLKVEDNYLLFLNEQGLFRVNGQDVNVYLGWNKSSCQYLLSDFPEVYKVIKRHKELTHFVDVEDNGHSLESVQGVRNLYTDEEGDYCYPDLETEFEHRKQLEVINSYTPVYKEYPDVLEPVEVRCVGDVVDTGSRFIENALAYGAAGFSNGNMYKLDFSAITADELSRFVKDNELQDKYKCSEHSNVHYAQIDGKYVMTNLPYSNKDKKGFAKTLAEAQEKEASVRKQVRDHLNVSVLGTSVAMNGKSVAAMYGDIERWIQSLYNIEVKQKHSTQKTSLINRMSEVKKSLSDLIDKQ